jgi:hypothetical protein
MSHGLMSAETIEAVLQSAASSAGVKLLTQERMVSVRTRSAGLRIKIIAGRAAS